MHRLLIAICLSSGLNLAFAQSTPLSDPPRTNQRAIPDDNLAYPVLVAAGSSRGSGFYLRTDDAVFLITAKHVLYDSATQQPYGVKADLLSYPKDLSDSTRNIISVTLPVLQANRNLRLHPTQDLVALRLFDISKASRSQPTGSLVPVQGVDVASIAKSGILTVDIAHTVKKYDQVLTGNDVMVFGYPTSLGLQQVPQLDPLRPLLRKGVVAGTNPATKFLVLDCRVYFGNSGGPVLEIDRQPFGISLSIIGVVDQYVPFVQQAGSQTLAMQLESNSGYSLAIPMDYVLDLVK